MTLLELWKRVRQRRIRFTFERDDLCVHWPRDDLPHEIVEAIRMHKASILAVLRPRPPKPSGAPYDDKGMPAGTPHEHSTIGQVRARVASTAMAAGLTHSDLGDLVRRVTGRGSLWELGHEELLRVGRAVDALEPSGARNPQTTRGNDQ